MHISWEIRGSFPHYMNKNRSVNNDCLSKHDECTRELQERHVADAQLLEADQQLPEPIQPGEGALDHPPPGATLRMASARRRSASLGHMGPIPALDHRAPGGLPGVALIRTQVVSDRWAPHDQAVQRGHQEPHIMPVRPADDYRQRDSTAVHEDAALRAFFSPDPSGWPRRPLGS